MQQNTYANNYFKFLISVCIFSYLFCYASTISLSPSSDDGVFLSVYNTGDIFQFLVKNFKTWSGRFSIELIMTSTIGIEWFWRIGIPASVILTGYSISKIVFHKSSILLIGMFVFIFSQIPSAILGDSAWWVTGFYNYLLPTSIALYLFSTLQLVNINKAEKIACIALSFYVSYMEQVALCLLVAIVVMLLINKNSRTRYRYFVLAIIAINFIACVKSPGNVSRLSIETLNWMPGYKYFNILDMISLGWDKLYQIITLKYNIPFSIFCISLLYASSKTSPINFSLKFSMIVISSFPALMIYHSLCGGIFFEGNLIDSGNYSLIDIYISYFYVLVLSVSILLVLIDMLLSGLSSPLPIFSFLISYMSVVIMGFSPTVYASGFRVYYVFEILCILNSMYFLVNSVKKQAE